MRWGRNPSRVGSNVCPGKTPIVFNKLEEEKRESDSDTRKSDIFIFQVFNWPYDGVRQATKWPSSSPIIVKGVHFHCKSNNCHISQIIDTLFIGFGWFAVCLYSDSGMYSGVRSGRGTATRKPRRVRGKRDWFAWRNCKVWWVYI